MHTNYLVNGPQTWTSPLGSKMASMTLDPCAIRKQLIWDSGVLEQEEMLQTLIAGSVLCLGTVLVIAHNVDLLDYSIFNYIP